MSNMRVQVLVAAMHKNHNLLEEMNIQTDAIIGNQCDFNSVEKFKWKDCNILFLNFAERGVGLNRNNALIRANADICLFADDDMRYVDEYEKIIQKAFEERPNADAIIFNINTIGEDAGRRINKTVKRIRFYNSLNYGTVRLAVRRSSLLRKRIYFSNCFGGGAVYSFGEDTLLICDMLKNGLKIYTSPEYIATVDQTSSTWFDGYNEKYLYDKGAIFKAAFGVLSPVICLQDLLRHNKLYKEAKISLIKKYKIMCRGSKQYSELACWEAEVKK